MITAVDTSVLVDLFGADPEFGDRSREALKSCRAEGSLRACEVVWAEVSGYFETPDDAAGALEQAEVRFDPLSRDAALAAGRAWGRYRRRGGRRTRVVPDFLIGAHALLQAERLLTRDRGFYRTYFSRVRVLDPAR